MQYIISPVTDKRTDNLYQTCIWCNYINSFAAIESTPEESRLKAIKLAMLLAIQESENNYRLSALVAAQHKI